MSLMSCCLQVHFNKFYHAFEIWSTKMSTAGVPTFSQELTLRQGQINAGWELLKLCVGRSEHTFAALLLGVFEKFTLPPSHPAVIKLISMCDELLREIQVCTKLTSSKRNLIRRVQNFHLNISA